MKSVGVIGRIFLLSINSKNWPIEHLGLGYITSFLREKGYEVMLSNVYNDDEIDIEKITRFSPDIVGLAIYDHNRDQVMSLARVLKNILTDVFTVLGSPYATVNYKELLEMSHNIDYIVLGEGEIPFYKLVEALMKGGDADKIPGIAYRKSNQIISNGKGEFINLDELPSPERDRNTTTALGFRYILSQRSCGSNCSFCSIRQLWGTPRYRSIRKLINEIKEIYKMGYRHMIFLDASVDSYGYDRLLEIADTISSLKLDISFKALFRAHTYPYFDQNLIDKLKSSGLIIAGIGIESFVEDDLRVYGKRATATHNIETIKFFNNNQIAMDLGFMLFNPYSRIENVHKNMAAFEELHLGYKINRLFSAYHPYKGTRLFERLNRDNLLMKVGFDNYEVVYKDQKVEALLSFYNKYIQSYYGEKNILSFEGHYLQSLFSDFRFRFNTEKYKYALELVEITEKNIKQILIEISNKNIKWFKLLLNNIKNEIDPEKSLDAISQIISRQDLSNYRNKLFNLMFGMHIKLEKEHKEFKEWRLNTSKYLILNSN